MLDVPSLLLFATALFVAAGSPGPSVAALVARVMTRGVAGVLPFLAALWIGEAIWLSLAVFGLALVAQSFQHVFAAIKYLGVAYLAWLAWKMWTAPVAAGDGSLPPDDAPSRLFFGGLAVSLGNPKVMMFYLALLPTLVDLDAVTLVGWTELVAAMLVVLAVIDLGWAVAAAQARKLLKSPRAMRISNRVSAATMAGAAVAMAAR